ncbi:MAG: SAM-dependent chlorinase/fluorinase, partial [Flavobacteriales bacterium]|nr:SAM-dependent chlorinase/fluorinase [Flavobacteriales bacterium]
HYVAVVKAAIYRHLADAVIVDISHQVRPFDAAQAALLLRCALPDFPKGTIHIVGVRPERTSRVEHLAIELNGQFIIGADNGMFPLMLAAEPARVHSLEHVSRSVGITGFPVRDIFSLAACHLAKGGTMEVLGKATSIRNRGTAFQPAVLDNAIRGIAVHVDNYGNIITNMDRGLFDAVRRERNFEIRFRRGMQRATRIHEYYGNVEEGEVVAMFASTGFLQIAINGGSAAQLLGVRPGDIVSVEFR